MKKARKTFMAIASVCVALCLTSCLSEEEPTHYMRGHFVIEGANPNYTLYSNDGFVIRLSPSSVTNATSGAGFGNNKRGYFDISFEEKDVKSVTGTDGKEEHHITNAQLMGGSFVTILSPMSHASATDRNIAVADSMFAVTKCNDLWYHRGYLNMIVTAPYTVKDSKGIYPTMNMMYDEQDISENSIKLTLLYNRHSAKGNDVSSMEGNFVTAYTMNTIKELVPGNDSITVTVEAEGIEAKKIKMAR